jgi:signal transduction histidine kinase
MDGHDAPLRERAPRAQSAESRERGTGLPAAVSNDWYTLALGALLTQPDGAALVRDGKVVVGNERFGELERNARRIRRFGAERAPESPRGGRTLRAIAVLLAASARSRRARNVNEDGSSWRRFFAREGDLVIEARAVVLDAPDGDPVALVHVRDATVADRCERELAEAQRALLEQERMRAIGEMTSGVAHDLNNTLNALSLRIDVLKRGRTGTGGEQGSNLDVISRILSDASERVSRLQDFARRRRDRPLEEVDLCRVIRDATEMARTQLEQRNVLSGVDIQIVLDLPALPPVTGVAAELRHVFVNLLLNARDAMTGSGKINIRGSILDDGAVVASVEDEGSGIPEGLLDKIFDPFFTTKGQRGTGLGLSMAARVMQRVGGSIEAANRPLGGAVFTLRFGRFQRNNLTPATRPGVASGPVPRGLRILLVDDNDESLTATRDALQSTGQVVDVVRNGEAALAQARSGRRYDLVLCDVGMPDMNGFRVAAELREITPKGRIYLLTGWAKEIPENDERRALVDGILPKPINLECMAQLLRAVPIP